jgi:hypothetical protein
MKEMNMEYNSHFKNCRNDDVISFGAELYKFSKFSVALISAIKKIGNVVVSSLDSDGIKGTEIYVSRKDYRHGSYQDNSKWLNEGKDCEILRIGSNGWQKGKMRIKVIVEFQPDEPEIPETQNDRKPEIVPPESPLDDLRQMMN